MLLSSSNIVPPFGTPHPARRAALAAAAVAGLAVTGASPGSASSGYAVFPPHSAAGTASASANVSHETPDGAVVTAVDVVTLVTGDRVRVTTFSDGRTSASIVSGSPHFGATIKTVRTPSAVYVMPELPVSEQTRFDISMFNVSALARLSGNAVPVTITFGQGVRPHAVPGLTADLADARPAPGGTTVVAAHYSASAAGVTTSGDAWRGVTSVVLPSGASKSAPAGQQMHTLTIKVANLHGGPVRSEQAWVQNVDNVNVFLEPVRIANGVGTISVPEGNYAVFAGSFTRSLIKPDFAVAADTSITMRLSDATVRPTEAVPGYGVVEAGATIQRDSARGGGFVEVFASDRYVFRVQPVARHVQHGHLRSTVNGTHAPASEPLSTADKCMTGSGCPPTISTTLAYTKDFSFGVPADMSFTHPKADFAIVPQQFHANGPAGVNTTDALAFAPFELLSFGTEYPVRVPSLRTIWLQGSKQLRWEQDYLPTAAFGPRPASLTKFSGYTAGAALPVVFAHGPVGPGIEAAFDKDHLGAFCLMCRNGNILHGVMPLFSGAGTAMSGLLGSPAMGSWSLRRGSHVLSSGNSVIAPRVTLPTATHSYTLNAVSHPGVRSWQLSTNVGDVWTFNSGSGDSVIPLLMPSYVPRTALDGSLRPGPTRFPLDFGNIGSANATVTRATVELSADGGAHWTRATVTRVDRNSFAVTYQNPKATASRSTMSIRVTGVDSAGRKVTETALNVYRLVR